MKKVLIVGSGLGALTTALRLHRRGYRVEMVEKYHQAGGRLNQLKKDGFTWDLGPTFFSMTYEFQEFFEDAQLKEMPFTFRELDTLYAVSFRGFDKRYFIYKDLDKLAAEFEAVEPNFKEKMTRFLASAGSFFHDVEHLVLKKNYDSIWDYLLTLMRVPPKYTPRLFRSVWQEMERHFESREVKEIFSLVAFFLGATPFDTPSIYTLLSYTELVHDGYHNVFGGMYKIVEGLKKEIDKAGIPIHFNTEIVAYQEDGNKKVKGFVDQNGKTWEADLFVVNADAALFRHKIFRREKFTEEKMDKMKWTLAPLTIYIGLDTKLENVPLHNYFLGNNFEEYAGKIFKNSIKLDQPYYYVNVVSKSDPEAAPAGSESLFILCPVPDRRFKPNWDDKEQVAANIIDDLSQRIGIDLKKHIVSQTVLSPIEWEESFNLYKGSGLGLGHNLTQIGGFRPKNFDEVYKNVFYVGASTVPGTGLPMAVISSKLVVERITKAYGSVHK
ncbi:MAG: phytoene desaturase family protein [Bacteroidales bacterium]|jgi:phytoene desaturase|nr:phytoene desaturase family protein [Bacteroidales bacterium]NLM93322.1 phytoene desaturase [Bacteroidales bacterium]